MRVTRRDHSGYPTLDVAGALVGRHWLSFVGELRAVIAEGTDSIGVDLSKVTRMGQAEAQFLMDMRDRMARHHRVLTLVGLSPASINAISHACVARF